MDQIGVLRKHLIRLLSWSDAHANFDAAVANVPVNLRRVAPPGFPHSAWQLVEHIRLTQADILAFCTRPDYKEGRWPDDYWPRAVAPPDGEAWDASIAAYRRDLASLQELVNNSDLFAKVPAGTGQTFLREFVLVADHTAYHVGQLIAVRRLLGDWAAA
jgi:DinB superfamily